MDINEGVPLPKKLTTPLPELPKMVPPPAGDIDQGVALPEKLERAPESRVAFMPLPTMDNLSEFNRQLKVSSEAAAKVDAQLPEADRNRKYVPLAPQSVRLEPVTIKRPVEESARLAGGGFDLLKVKKMSEKAPTRGDIEFGVTLPPRPPLRAFGNREEKVFEPAGSSIPTFVPRDNTQIKISEKLSGLVLGTLQVAKCSVAFDIPKMGQPMMRRVRIVWPAPMEKASSQPSSPFLGALEMQGLKASPSGSFPGQHLPTGARPVDLRAPEEKPLAKVQIPMPKRSEPMFMGLQDPPRLGPRKPDAEENASAEKILAEIQKRAEELIGKATNIKNVDPAKILAELSDRAPAGVLSEIAKRVQAIMSREAQAKDLEAENEALREAVKTLGGKVALLEAEIQILKAKRG